jgi:hypothetical protein
MTHVITKMLMRSEQRRLLREKQRPKTPQSAVLEEAEALPEESEFVEISSTHPYLK